MLTKAPEIHLPFSEGSFANTQNTFPASLSFSWVRLNPPSGVTSSKESSLASQSGLGKSSGVLKPSRFLPLKHIQLHQMTSIDEAGLPIRLGTPVRNELGLFASVDPISRETPRHCLLTENRDAAINPKPSPVSHMCYSGTSG